MNSKIIEISGLKKKLNSRFSLDIENLHADRNKILTIIGPNGSGKSSLIKIINLLEKPDEGKMYFNGTEVTNGNTDKAKIRKKMSVVFQEPLLFNSSVYNNIIMGLKIRKIKPSTARDRIDYYIKKLKIGSLLGRSIKNLSGGEKQRISLARALILDPELLLLDEPLANIDQQSREDLRRDIFELIKDFRKSIIYVTHDRNDAMVVADDIAVLNNGRIEQFAQKEDIFRKPKNEFIAKFVGAETLLRGEILSCIENVCRVKVSGDGVKPDIFAAGEGKKGEKVVLAIRPEDVTLYGSKVSNEKSSAMNRFVGKIIDITDIGIFKKVEIDCGFTINSFVTENSVSRMELALGKEISAGIKATSIHILGR